eukprot:GEMP01014820.1.p1 GENE.GEMP01014820.1~~GEMP01014820.1.p1  ORF type:complete len:273 (+),score=42.27 GEMP01014820.1:169-987(+)
MYHEAPDTRSKNRENKGSKGNEKGDATEKGKGKAKGKDGKFSNDGPREGAYAVNSLEINAHPVDQSPIVTSSTRAVHQLHNSWKLWVLMHRSGAGQQSKGKWSDQQQPVHEFSTVEDFWSLHNHAHQSSRLENADYSLFKKNVTPAWEDASCRQGGRWVAKLEKVKAQSLDNLWQSLCLALIGEAWTTPCVDTVVGGVVSVRSRASKIALWMNNARDDQKVVAIGHYFRGICIQTPDLHEISTREFLFEDFRKKSITMSLTPGNTIVYHDSY